MVGWKAIHLIPLISVISVSTGFLYPHLHFEEWFSGPQSHLFRPEAEGYPPVAPQIFDPCSRHRLCTRKDQCPGELIPFANIGTL